MLEKIKTWCDTHLIAQWRVWWKLWSMRFAALFSLLLTYLTIVPSAFSDAVGYFPPWLRDSLPVWVGPATLGFLFLVRFWDQAHVAKNPPVVKIEDGVTVIKAPTVVETAPAPAAPAPEVQHGDD